MSGFRVGAEGWAPEVSTPTAGRAKPKKTRGFAEGRRHLIPDQLSHVFINVRCYGEGHAREEQGPEYDFQYHVHHFPILYIAVYSIYTLWSAGGLGPSLSSSPPPDGGVFGIAGLSRSGGSPLRSARRPPPSHHLPRPRRPPPPSLPRGPHRRERRPSGHLGSSRGSGAPAFRRGRRSFRRRVSAGLPLHFADEEGRIAGGGYRRWWYLRGHGRRLPLGITKMPSWVGAIWSRRHFAQILPEPQWT